MDAAGQGVRILQPCVGVYWKVMGLWAWPVVLPGVDGCCCKKTANVCFVFICSGRVQALFAVLVGAMSPVTLSESVGSVVLGGKDCFVRWAVCMP